MLVPATPRGEISPPSETGGGGRDNSGGGEDTRE